MFCSTKKNHYFISAKLSLIVVLDTLKLCCLFLKSPLRKLQFVEIENVENRSVIIFVALDIPVGINMCILCVYIM